MIPHFNWWPFLKDWTLNGLYLAILCISNIFKPPFYTCRQTSGWTTVRITSINWVWPAQGEDFRPLWCRSYRITALKHPNSPWKTSAHLMTWCFHWSLLSSCSSGTPCGTNVNRPSSSWKRLWLEPWQQLRTPQLPIRILWSLQKFRSSLQSSVELMDVCVYLDQLSH